MPISAIDLKDLLVRAFPAAEIGLVDLAGDRDHYQVTICSAEFSGKPRILQHRMVYEALKGIDLHAVSIVTTCP